MKSKFFILYSSFFILLVSCNEHPADPIPTPVDELKDSSAYISKVFTFEYAPGQYAANTLLTDSQNIIGKPSYLFTVAPTNPKSALSLGGWGGYVVGGFNHSINNITGNDFIVLCGSSSGPEPAVIYVMQDVNSNGKPDDLWYELKGSEHTGSNTYHDYQVTYYKAVNTSSNIFWKDNKGNTDTLKAGYGSTYTATWWPDASKDSLVFTGTRLPLAYHNMSLTATENWLPINGLFSWGYGENANGTDYNGTYKGNEFDISNAVDASGNAVTLTSIRFIKIQTAVFQQAGWLNEVSTEIYGAADLNMLR